MTDCRGHPASEIPSKCLPVDADYLTKELKVTAQRELFEDEDSVEKGLKLLRTLLKEEKDFLWQDDDHFLVAFLRARKFDVRKSVALVKGFYTTFGRHADLYYGMDFERLREIMAINTLDILPYRDSQGCVVVVIRFRGWNPAVISTEEALAYMTFAFLQALLSPATQVAGFHYIQDFKDFGIKHLLNLTPGSVKLFIEIIQNTVPARMRGFHAVNENLFFSKLWPVMKPFVPKKLRERFYFHGSDMKSLHEFFHPSILPADLGGQLPPFENTKWRQRMEASADYIERLRSFGYKKYLKKDWKRKKSRGEPVKENGP